MLKSLLKRSLRSKSGRRLFVDVASDLISVPNVTDKASQTQVKQWVLKGVANQQKMPYLKHRIWPFWVQKQLDPRSNSYNIAGFPLTLLNSTHRNWTRLGHPKTTATAILDPTGMLTPHPQSWSQEHWLKINGTLHTTCNTKHTTQSMANEAPVIQTQSHMAEATLTVTTLMDKQSESEPFVHQKTTVKNRGHAPINISYFVAIRPYNMDGLAPIESVTYLNANAFVINDELATIFHEKPDNIVCLAEQDGDVSEQVGKLEMILHARCEKHLASAFVEYRFQLNPGQEKQLSVSIPVIRESKLKKWFQKSLRPYQQKSLQNRIRSINKSAFEITQSRVIKIWESRLKSKASLQLPNQNWQQRFNQSCIHLQQIRKFQDIPGLEGLGLLTIGSTSLMHRNFSSWQGILLKNLSQAPIDQLGQWLFLLYALFQYTGKKELLEQHQADVKYMMRFLSRMISQNKADKAYGWVKKSRSLDPLGQEDFYIWDNYWVVIGIKCAHKIADVLEKEQEANTYHILAKKLESRLNDYMKSLSEKHKLAPIIPVSQATLQSAALINSFVAIYPMPLMNPYEDRVTNTLGLIEKDYLVDGIYFNPIGHAGFNIRENCLLGQTFVARKDQAAFELIDWITDQATETGTWPKAIHPRSKGGSIGDGHDLLSSAEYINLMASLLVKVEKDCLHLTPFIPQEWIEQDGQFHVHNIGTRLGPVSYDVYVNGKRITYNIEFKSKLRPELVRITLPKMIDFATVDGTPLEVSNTTFTVSAAGKTIECQLI